MVSLLVLVYSCFRENVIVTFKIVSFLCSLDGYFSSKTVIDFFFENQTSKWRLFQKGLILTYFSHFLVTREKTQKSFSIYLTYIHTRILPTLLTFCLTEFAKLLINHVWFLFDATPDVDSYLCHFGAINKFRGILVSSINLSTQYLSEYCTHYTALLSYLI